MCEAAQSLRLLPVAEQVLAQQVTERAQCVLLEQQPLRLQQPLGDGGLELATSTKLQLEETKITRRCGFSHWMNRPSKNKEVFRLLDLKTDTK